MKTILLFLTFSVLGYSQATGQICVQLDKTAPAKQVCMNLSPAMLSSLSAFVAAQIDIDAKPPVPRYKGVADAIFQNLTGGFFELLNTQYPPSAVTTAKANLDAAQVALDAAKAAVIAKPTPVPDAK